MSDNTIDVPPAVDYTLDAAYSTFSFDVGSACTICFGTASPAGSFPDLENKTFQWGANAAYTYPIPDVADASLPYNTSGPNSACDPVSITDNGKVIVIGAGLGSAGSTKRKPAKKTSSKKGAVKAAGGSKKKAPAKKKATKKAVKKSATKKAAKKAAKKAPAKSKAKPKTKAKAKAKTKKGKSRR